MGQVQTFQRRPLVDAGDFLEHRDRFVSADLSDHCALLCQESKCATGPRDWFHIDFRTGSQCFDQRQPRRHLRSDSCILGGSRGVRLGRPSQCEIRPQRNSNEWVLKGRWGDFM